MRCVATVQAAGVGVYAQVLDLVETLEPAAALGGAAIAQPMDLPTSETIAQMSDTEGNIIGLVQQ